MKAVRLYGKMDFRMDDIPMPKCGKGEVLLKTEYCGVCGSDSGHALAGDPPFVPNTFGHEFSARVVEIGEGVTKVKVGELVAAIPLIVCHQCVHCREGNFGQCLNRKFIGLRVPDVGGMAEYNVLPEINCLKLSEGMNPIHAAFIEPTSVAIHGLMRINFKPGQDLAVIGTGPIGQMTIQVAKVWGAKRIFAFDINDAALERAKNVGASFVYNTGKTGFLDEFLKETDGLGVPQVVEACGLPQTILLSCDVCRVGGEISLVGAMMKDVTIPPEVFYRKISYKQYTLRGVWQSYSLDFPGDEWRLAAHYIHTRQVDVEPMIYKVASIDDAPEVYKEYLTPGKVKGKILFKF